MQRIQKKSNNNNKQFRSTFYVKNYLYNLILYTVFMRFRIFETQ